MSATTSNNKIEIDEQDVIEPENYLIQILSNPNLPIELKPYFDAFSKFYQNK